MTNGKWSVLLLAGALLLAAFALSGCGGGQDDGGRTGGGPQGSITVEGSDTMVNMATAWAQEFMKENEGVQVAVSGGGSGKGIAALINGTVDFANASREMKAEEVRSAEDAGIEPERIVVAKDGIAVVAHPGNAVEGLTMDQLGKVFRGEITNWKDLGGKDAEIVLLSRDHSSGTYEYFKEEVVGKEREYAKSARFLASTQAIIDEVQGNEDAIGYVGVGYATSAGAGVRVIAIDGVKASVETVRDKSYVLGRDLYMYAAGKPDGAAKAYVEWVLGAEGQKIVEEQGFVPVDQ